MKQERGLRDILNSHYDIVLKTSQEPVFAHKCVLNLIPEFNHFFSNPSIQKKDSEQRTIYDLSEYRQKSLEIVIKRFYDSLCDKKNRTQYIPHDEEDIPDFIKLIHRFNFGVLKISNIRWNRELSFSILDSLSSSILKQIIPLILVNYKNEDGIANLLSRYSNHIPEAQFLELLSSKLQHRKIEQHFPEKIKAVCLKVGKYNGNSTEMMKWAWQEDLLCEFCEGSLRKSVYESNKLEELIKREKVVAKFISEGLINDTASIVLMHFLQTQNGGWEMLLQKQLKLDKVNCAILLWRILSQDMVACCEQWDKFQFSETDLRFFDLSSMNSYILGQSLGDFRWKRAQCLHSSLASYINGVCTYKEIDLG